MDEKIEAFREEVLQWRGTRKTGAKPYTAEMKATALQFAKHLQRKGAAVDVAAKRLVSMAIKILGKLAMALAG